MLCRRGAAGDGPPSANGGFAQVSAGSFHSCGVLKTGTVQCWGSDNNGQASPPNGDNSRAVPVRRLQAILGRVAEASRVDGRAGQPTVEMRSETGGNEPPPSEKEKRQWNNQDAAELPSGGSDKEVHGTPASGWACCASS